MNLSNLTEPQIKAIHLVREHPYSGYPVYKINGMTRDSLMKKGIIRKSKRNPSRFVITEKFRYHGRDL